MRGGFHVTEIDLRHDKQVIHVFAVAAPFHRHAEHALILAGNIHAIDLGHAVLVAGQFRVDRLHRLLIARVFCQHAGLVKILHAEHVVIFARLAGSHPLRSTEFFHSAQCARQSGRNTAQIVLHAVRVGHVNRIGVAHLHLVVHPGNRYPLHRTITAVLRGGRVLFQFVAGNNQHLRLRIGRIIADDAESGASQGNLGLLDFLCDRTRPPGCQHEWLEFDIGRLRTDRDEHQ